MITVIAEKPSLARSIEKALELDGERFKNKGEYSQSEHYYVTSAFGHIYTLKDMEGYKTFTGGKYWTLDPLPFFPEKYEYKQVPKTGDRIKAIKELLKKSDSVIHAGDADREGQIIVDIILSKCGWKGDTKRVWISATEPKSLNQAFHNLKPNKEYHNLSEEGFTRSYADWAYGINLSRYVSILSKQGCSVGRVVGAIVKLIYDRDMEIRNFKAEPYWQLSHPFGNLEIESKFKLKEKEKSDKQLAIYNKANTFVKDVKKKQVVKTPPKLFSQTKLQNACSSQFGWNAEKTLSVTQKLYETGYTTYPRTDSEHMTVAEKALVKDIIKAHKHPHMKFKDTKRVFDDSKVESHSAITPTVKVPNGLSGDLEKCYKLIFNRFLANFHDEDFIVNHTDIIVEVSDSKKKYEEIKVSGETVVQKGWSAFEKTSSEKLLPDVKPGDKLDGIWKQNEKETKPPAHYTVATLNNKLKSPFSKDETADDDDFNAVKEGIQIGTSATRAPEIKKAREKGYISLEKNTYYIQPTGEFLIETLEKLHIDMSKEKTVELSKSLKAVANGKKNRKEVLDSIYGEIREIIGQDISDKQISSSGTSIGKCPFCGGNIIETKGSYRCESCDFWFAKKIAKRKINTGEAARLIADGDSGLLDGFIGKSGKKFNAHILIEKNGNFYTKFEF